MNGYWMETKMLNVNEDIEWKQDALCKQDIVWHGGWVDEHV